MATLLQNKRAITPPNIWQRCLWWLTPLGRARLALLDQHYTDNPAALRTCLQSGLSILRTSRDASAPSNVALISLILERLALLALARADYADTAHLLLQMDDISGSWQQ